MTNEERMKQIARDILSLANDLNDDKSLKEAWRIISPAFMLLSKKDDWFDAEQRALESLEGE